MPSTPRRILSTCISTCISTCTSTCVHVCISSPRPFNLGLLHRRKSSWSKRRKVPRRRPPLPVSALSLPTRSRKEERRGAGEEGVSRQAEIPLAWEQPLSKVREGKGWKERNECVKALHTPLNRIREPGKVSVF